MGTISHVHERLPKTVLRAWNFVYEKLRPVKVANVTNVWEIIHVMKNWPVMSHLLSTYARLSVKQTFFTPWYAHVRVRIRGQEIFFFLWKFAYVLNGWSLSILPNLSEVNGSTNVDTVCQVPNTVCLLEIFNCLPSGLIINVLMKGLWFEQFGTFKISRSTSYAHTIVFAKQSYRRAVNSHGN